MPCPATRSLSWVRAMSRSSPTSFPRGIQKQHETGTQGQTRSFRPNFHRGAGVDRFWLGSYRIVHYLRTAPRFEVEKLSVSGLKRVNESQVLATAGFEV